MSTDTQEMFYSSKRQQYLIDQGYTFKIVTNLSEIADSDAIERGFQYATSEADRDLLRTVLNSNTEMEKDQRAEDTAIRKKNADGAALADESVRRVAGSTLTRLSGAGSRLYRETNIQTKRHALFKKRAVGR